MSSTKEKIVLARQIQYIVKRNVTVKQIATLEFADFLRNYTFNSLDEKNVVLRNYCDIVLTPDRICATFIDLGFSPSIKTFDLQLKIRRGKNNNDVLAEFNCKDELAIPKWYLTSKIRDDSIKVPIVNNGNQQNIRQISEIL